MSETLTQKPGAGKNKTAPAGSGRPVRPPGSEDTAGPSRAPQRSAVPPSPTETSRAESEGDASARRRREHGEDAGGARSRAEACVDRAPRTHFGTRRPMGSFGTAIGSMVDPVDHGGSDASPDADRTFEISSRLTPKVNFGGELERETHTAAENGCGISGSRSALLTGVGRSPAPQAPSVDRKQWRQTDPEKLRGKRAELWKLKEQGWKWLPDRTRQCHSHRIGPSVEVAIWHDEQGHRRANYRHLETCSNVNICPLCAIRIRTVRAMELAEQAEAWCEAHGGKDAISLLTLTHRHHAGHSLRELLAGEHRAWKRFKDAIRKHYAAAWGWRGEVRADDTTHGENGWHPHFHIMVFWESPLSNGLRLERQKVLRELWEKCVVREMGEEHRPNAHGVDLSNGAKAARYLLKLCFELSDPISKKGKAASERDHEEKGRTPFELLSDAGDGDERAGFLFREYGAAFKGRRVFEYSRSGDFKAALRKLAGQDDEQTDEAIMDGGDVGTVELAIPGETWREICRVKGSRAELLSKMERDGAEEARSWLAREGLWRRPHEEFFEWLEAPLVWTG